MMIALLGVAVLAVTVPVLAVTLIGAASRREHAAHQLADASSGYFDAVALGLWSAAMSANRRTHRGTSAATLPAGTRSRRPGHHHDQAGLAYPEAIRIYRIYWRTAR